MIHSIYVSLKRNIPNLKGYDNILAQMVDGEIEQEQKEIEMAIDGTIAQGLIYDVEKDEIIHFESIKQFLNLLYMRYNHANVYFYNLILDGSYVTTYAQLNGFTSVMYRGYRGDLDDIIIGNPDKWTLYHKTKLKDYSYNFLQVGSFLMVGEDKLSIQMNEHSTSAFEQAYKLHDKQLVDDLLILKTGIDLGDVRYWFENGVFTTRKKNGRHEIASKPKNAPREFKEVCTYRKEPRNVQGWRTDHNGEQQPIFKPLTEEQIKQRRLKTKQTADDMRKTLNDPNSSTTAKKRAATGLAKLMRNAKLTVDELENDLVREVDNNIAHKAEQKRLMKQLKKAVRPGLNYINKKYHAKTIIGEGQSYDFRSMYPYVRGNYPMPSNHRKETIRYYKDEDFKVKRNFTKEEAESIDRNELIFVFFKRLVAKVKDDKMPILGSGIDEQVKSEVMLKSTVLTGPDYWYLIDNYDIDWDKTRLTKVWIMHRDYELEHRWREELEELELHKNDAKPVERAIAKGTANVQSGSAVMSEKEYKVTKMSVENYRPVIKVATEINHNNDEKAKIMTTRSGQYNDEFAAGIFTYAYARIIVAETVNKVGMDNYLYSDTDSGHFKGTREEIEKNIKVTTSDKVGTWGWEYTFNKAFYSTLKNYIECMDDKIVKVALAGVSIPEDYEIDFDKFVEGLQVPSKSVAPAIGGYVETTYLKTIGGGKRGYELKYDDNPLELKKLRLVKANEIRAKKGLPLLNLEDLKD